jgi:hypothetical protein
VNNISFLHWSFIIIIVFHSHISFTFLLNYVLGIIPSEPSQTQKPLVSPSTFSFIKPPLPDTVQLFVPLPEKLPIRELHWLFKHAIPVSSAISHQAPRNHKKRSSSNKTRPWPDPSPSSSSSSLSPPPPRRRPPR